MIHHHAQGFKAKVPMIAIKDGDLSSAAQYPAVFKDFATVRAKYGNLSDLPTRQFLQPMAMGDSVRVPAAGRELDIKYVGMGEIDASGQLEVLFEVNGKARSSFVTPDNPGSHVKRTCILMTSVP